VNVRSATATVTGAATAGPASVRISSSTPARLVAGGCSVSGTRAAAPVSQLVRTASAACAGLMVRPAAGYFGFGVSPA
jgi:hypothetical protein